MKKTNHPIVDVSHYNHLSAKWALEQIMFINVLLRLRFVALEDSQVVNMTRLLNV